MNTQNRLPNRTGRREALNLHVAPLRILTVMLVILLAGCATRVEYFTNEAYTPRVSPAQMQWLEEEPSRSHIELARITVTSANLSDQSLRRKLLERARTLGADAVVREPGGSVVQHVGSPYYEPGLFSPAGAAFLLYGYGWYMPFTSNPYILSQGATDQPRVDHYVSAIAIRYRDDQTPAATDNR